MKKVFMLIITALILSLIFNRLVSFTYAQNKSFNDLIKELERKTEELKRKTELLFAFKPNVFRDIEWGTLFEECQGMILFKSEGEDKFYKKEGEILKIRINRIEKSYVFHKNQLMAIIIETVGEDNFRILKQVVFAEFDKGIQFDKSIPEWFWVDILGGGVRLLRYEEPLQKATLYLLSVAIYNQKEKREIRIQQLQPKLEWSKIIAWQGSGIKTTQPFEIKGSMWRIKWQNLGDILQVYVYRLDGDLAALPVNTLEKGEDVSYIYEKGQFYLTINAIGRWSIEVEEKE